jgi:tetratricopeptide (TPR) repeat protein
MAFQNWDDHDRSNKYTALANAKGYLESCEPNAILFTIGDNDTFPLWYAQEIEGIRRDVRVVNTQLFMTDWHIDQMKAKAYDSEPLPISFDRSHYVGDKLDYCVYNEITQNRWELKNFLDFIKSDDQNTMLEMQSGQSVHFFPTNKIRIPIDKSVIIKNKVVAEKYYDSIVPYIDVDIKDRAIYKARIMMFDVIANNNWKRPIYFTGGSFTEEDYLWMKDYLQLDGLVYKLVPIKTPVDEENNPFDMGQIDSDKMYDIVMKWDWGNGERTDIYHDTETRRNSITYRTNLSRLMQQLIVEGKTEKAKKVIELAINKMPIDLYGYYTMVEPFTGGYYDIGEVEKARALLQKLASKYQDNLNYYSGIAPSEQNDRIVDIVTNLERYRSLLYVMKEKEDIEFYEKNKKIFNGYNKRFERFNRKDE